MSLPVTSPTVIRMVMQAAAVLLAGLLLACSGGESSEAPATATGTASSTATRAPEPTATPAPTETHEPTPEPTPEPPPPPTATMSAPPAQPQTGGGGAAPPPPPPPPSLPTTVQVSADRLAFSPNSISVPANSVVTVVLQNNDAQVAHDIQIVGLGASNVCTGPCTVSATFNSGAAGSYNFLCSTHPFMRGTLVVQ